MKILLVEDDEVLVQMLTKRLVEHHYAVDAVTDGVAAWEYASTYEYELLVLDVVLPKLDGISLCQRLRAAECTTPILLLTGQDTSVAKIMGLNAGADDYVVKPFDEAELIARIRALLRRSSTNPLPVLTWGELWLNFSTCEVTYAGKPLTLTAKEYALLELLLRESQHVFSNEEILESLWSSEEFPVDATVRSHIRRLRHKLTVVGAPPDLIATAHGRGYYLKPLFPEVSSPPASSLVAERKDCTSASGGWGNMSGEGDRQHQQTQYLEFLNQTWAIAQEKCLQQVRELQEAIAKRSCFQQIAPLQNTSFNPQQQEVAYRTAHTLAGTLGTFGLSKAMRLSRKLEQYLHCDVSLSSHSIPHLQALVNALQQEIAATSTIKSLAQPSPTTPPLFIVGCDPDFADALESVASQQSFDAEIFPTISHAQNWLDNSPQPPVGLILRLLDTVPTAALQFLQQFKQCYPGVPTAIISNQDDLSERLEVARHGGTCFLAKVVTPEQVWVAIAQHIQQTSELTRLTRVMIVDDDPILLKTLPSQLQSWGFEVSTLNDPQQFWNVLEAIHPDVLVLDVQMPQVNGLELCQVLRSDSHWQQLPVLFLSIFADASTKNQAFAVGADDYLCKPIAGMDLANRIRNRLQRVQAWAR